MSNQSYGPVCSVLMSSSAVLCAGPWRVHHACRLRLRPRLGCGDWAGDAPLRQAARRGSQGGTGRHGGGGLGKRLLKGRANARVWTRMSRADYSYGSMVGSFGVARARRLLLYSTVALTHLLSAGKSAPSRDFVVVPVGDAPRRAGSGAESRDTPRTVESRVRRVQYYTLQPRQCISSIFI